MISHTLLLLDDTKSIPRLFLVLSFGKVKRETEERRDAFVVRFEGRLARNLIVRRRSFFFFFSSASFAVTCFVQLPVPVHKKSRIRWISDDQREVIIPRRDCRDLRAAPEKNLVLLGGARQFFFLLPYYGNVSNRHCFSLTAGNRCCQHRHTGRIRVHLSLSRDDAVNVIYSRSICRIKSRKSRGDVDPSVSIASD